MKINNKFNIIKVIGISMNNLLDINDIVIVVSNSKYKIGDIIVFKENDSYIIHRILFIYKNKVLQAGDNGNDFSIIESRNIIGKAIMANKFNGININLDKSIFLNFISSIIIIIRILYFKIVTPKVKMLPIKNFKKKIYIMIEKSRNYIQNVYIRLNNET